MREERILSYAPRPRKSAATSLLGLVFCLCGLGGSGAIIGFGCWWMAAGDRQNLLWGGGILFLGGLMAWLCGRWYVKARRTFGNAEIIP